GPFPCDRSSSSSGATPPQRTGERGRKERLGGGVGRSQEALAAARTATLPGTGRGVATTRAPAPRPPAPWTDRRVFGSGLGGGAGGLWCELSVDSQRAAGIWSAFWGTATTRQVGQRNL